MKHPYSGMNPLDKFPHPFDPKNMKQIDLDEIIYSAHSHLDGYDPYDEKQIEAIENCIKTGIEQALDIASEEAEIKYEYKDWTKRRTVPVIDKDSILSIKERIK